MKRRLFLALATALTAAAGGCDALNLGLGGLPTPAPTPSAAASGAAPAPGGSPGASAAPTADPRLPTEPATIEGEIVGAEPAGAGGSLHTGRITVSAESGNRAVATLVPATSVWRQDAGGKLTRGGTGELQVGMKVRVWAGGPIRESFPIQFDAKVVVILAGGAGG